MNRILLLATLILSVISADAQYKWDIGLKAGGSNYLGDIGGQELTRRDFIWDMHLDDTRMNYSVFARRKMNKRWAIAANADYISIWGLDANSSNPARRARNLNFRNRIVELGGRAELTVFYDNDVGGKGYYDPDYRFFVFAGLAGFYHNPQGQIFEAVDDDGNVLVASYKSEWYDLRPFRTENQESEYEKIGLSVPVGVGMYFTFNKQFRLGWEVNWRTTFTDYLDDVSGQYGDIAEIEVRDGSALAQQSNQNIIDLICSDPETLGGAGDINNHQWTGEEAKNKRGDPTHNDSYLTMAVTGSYVIRGTSSFYKAKYSWLTQRRGSRRSRAKF
ncbi:MAG: DUF6089 family protein [Flavobacteriales bacterium]